MQNYKISPSQIVQTESWSGNEFFFFGNEARERENVRYSKKNDTEW